MGNTEAALRGASVVAVDINPHAVECCRLNAKRHNVASSIDARVGEEFAPIRPEERFDVIVAGLPWDNSPAEDVVALSMYDPDFKMRNALFQNAARVLRPGGRILMTYAEFIEQRCPLRETVDGYKFKIAIERTIKGEPHYVYVVEPE